VIAGLPPALAAMRQSVVGVIRSDARGAVGSRSRHRMLRCSSSQVAVAFVLANGAVLVGELPEDPGRNQTLDTEQSSPPKSPCAAHVTRKHRAGAVLVQLAGRLQACPA